MSYYLEIDGEQVGQLASNSGWGELGAWIESLPVADYPSLRVLWEQGFSERPGEVKSQLEAALQAHDPQCDDCRTTADGIIEMLGDGSGELVGVTNGMTADSD